MDRSTSFKVNGNLSPDLYFMTLLESAVANQMAQQTPQGGSIIGISSISALVGGELQWWIFPVILAFLADIHNIATTHPLKLVSYR